MPLGLGYWMHSAGSSAIESVDPIDLQYIIATIVGVPVIARFHTFKVL
jgi:hypothetical protein